MRKIRFRGVSIDTNDWVYGDCIHTTAGRNSVAISDDNRNLWPIYEASLGQMTDVVDQQGTPVYEGDFIKIDTDMYKDPLRVVFENSRFKLETLNLGDAWCRDGIIAGTVVGTTYFFGHKNAQGD